MHDVAMRRRVVVLLIAALLSVAGVSVVAATVANDAEAIAVTDNDTDD